MFLGSSLSLHPGIFLASLSLLIMFFCWFLGTATLGCCGHACASPPAHCALPRSSPAARLYVWLELWAAPKVLAALTVSLESWSSPELVTAKVPPPLKRLGPVLFLTILVGGGLSPSLE